MGSEMCIRDRVEKCAWVCDFYSENTKKFLLNRIIKTDAYKSYVRYDPLGIILAIMPWNFPFWQVFRFAAPAIMAGNVVVLKHASNVPQCALEIEKVFLKAGFEKGIFTTFLVSSEKIESIIKDKRIKGVTLTGSEDAGSNVAQCAGKNIKKSVLELGGSDPFIILEDADIKKAAVTGIQSRIINSGQSCISAKRFIVCKKIADKFLKVLIEELKKVKTGNPMLRETHIGPLARKDLKDTLQKQVDISVKKGAKIIFSSYIKEKKGYFFPLTLLINLKKDMPVMEEETF